VLPAIPVGWEGQCLEVFPQDLLFLEVAVRFALPPFAVMLPLMWPLTPAAFPEFGGALCIMSLVEQLHPFPAFAGQPLLFVGEELLGFLASFSMLPYQHPLASGFLAQPLRL